MMPTSHNDSNLDNQTFSYLYVDPVTMPTPFSLSLQTRLLIIIVISTSFFVIELAVGFCTHSLALIADAFHYIGDVLGFVVGWWILRVSSIISLLLAVCRGRRV
jgi:Co/Zn/Cd efflux system component